MSTQRHITGDLPPGVKAIVEKLSRFKTDPGHLDLQGVSDCVEALFQEIGSEDVGEITADAVSRGLLSQAQGNKIIEVSMWCGRTEGKQLSATIERWLEDGIAPVKIELGLAQSVFPFSTQTRMVVVLSPIAKRFPHLAPQINKMIERRRAQGV
jgi:hypothetical protein